MAERSDILRRSHRRAVARAAVAVVVACVTRTATAATDAPDVHGASMPEQPQMSGMGPGEMSDHAGRATGDWFGLRPRLADAGIMAGANLTADYSKVLDGGASPGGAAFRSLFTLSVTADAGRLLGVPGGTAFASFQNFAGDDGSRDVGDLQRFDSIDTESSRTQLSQIWYEQVLLEGRARVKVGKIDVNADLANPLFGGEFVHSAGGISPNIVVPQYPDPAFGVQLVVSPNDWSYIAGGAFDGSGQEGTRTGSYGPARLFGPPADLSLVAEVGRRWGNDPDRPLGRVALGAWHHTGTFDRLGSDADGGGAGRPLRGTSGYYAIVDLTLWRASPDDPRRVVAHLQYAYADPRAVEITHHAGGGVTWHGPLPGRLEDAAGVGISYAGQSDAAGFPEDAEVALELFYRLQVTPFLSIKPDLQYIRNPAGAGDVDDALVGTVRVEIEF